jgi:serine protease inhibitor
MYEFALNLNRRLASEGDLVWSPYSVASALGLAAAGARGDTYRELTGALGATPDALRLAEAAALDDAEIAVANTLWTREGLPVEEGYRRALASFPGAASHGADFAGDPDGARRAINADVAKTTRELIKDLLPPDAITRYTSAVIVNALYLKVAWRKRFQERATRPEVFHGPGGEREVAMMRTVERLPYAEEGGLRMVTLPAESGVAVDVIMGGEPTPEVLRRLYDTASPIKISLSLPKFRVEGQASLRGPLGGLGVITAFTDDADFSGISPEPLLIDRVEHKAVLDVDEAGFEGAASTAVIMVPAGLDVSTPLEFRVDREFTVIVRHPATEAVFFLARVSDPPSAS